MRTLSKADVKDRFFLTACIAAALFLSLSGYAYRNGGKIEGMLRVCVRVRDASRSGSGCFWIEKGTWKGSWKGSGEGRSRVRLFSATRDEEGFERLSVSCGSSGRIVVE